MSNSLFSHLLSLVACVVLWLLDTLLFWGLNRQWWRIRAVRRAFLMVPLVAVVTVGIWALGTALDARWVITSGAGATAVVMALLIALLIALPLSGLLLSGERLARWMAAFRGKRDAGTGDSAHVPPVQSSVPGPSPIASPEALQPRPSGPVLVRAARQPVNNARRSFVTRAAAAIPGAAIATAGYGLISSHGDVRMPEIPITFPGLHPDLNNLRILHLTDIHLGYYVGLDNLEELMQAAKRMRPDMVLVSGDIADDLAQLPGALRMIDALRPRYGTFATLGNHEYFRGIQNVVRIIDAGPIPLLRGSGASVKVGRGEIYIGGADDPVMMGHGSQNHQFLQNSVSAAFNGAPSDAFHLLMSHRPEGFDVAAEQGIAMTIAGHTHGAQVGFNGRSILEPWMRDRYLWGYYSKGRSQLYTSAGVGHWFPFRLGCPPEAPVYVLKRGVA